MPYGDPDPTDPSMLVGVQLPAGPETMRAMASVFAEEFARLGYSAPEILGLFQSPQFRGPHAALAALGEPAIRALIAEAVGCWPRVRIVDAPPEGEV